MKSSHFLSCDLGAESGRVMLGTLTSGKLYLEEIHRFPNQPVRFGDSVRWDIPGIFRELKAGLGKAAARGLEIRSLSVDSWGVDYIWIGAGQPLLALPYIYRDERIDQAFAEATSVVSKERLFECTGIQLLPFNTVFQLFSDHRKSPSLVGVADQFLPVADYFHYLFSGVAACEESLASTSQIYDPRTRNWSEPLIEEFQFRRDVFPRIVPSGTLLGTLTKEVSAETGLSNLEVVATCSHDTGAAVAAVPATNSEDWAYLSSGTWSLMGVELPGPLISPEVLDAGFTNEAGFGGVTRFLKNIVGLWILQECRREWEREGHQYTYEQITNLAAEAEPLKMLINPDDPRFLKPGEMPAKIEQFCRDTGQEVPGSHAQIARCILESLALIYRHHLRTLQTLTGRSIRVLHIVGGGSKSGLLNQFAASATRCTVIAGPTEATAIGNLLIQSMVCGEVHDLAELRTTVRNSFPIAEYLPEDAELWDSAFERFVKLAS